MAQSLIAVTLSQQAFKRSISTTLLHPHSSSSSSLLRSRSPSSVFFSRKIPLAASLSSQTAMGETPVAVDSGMDAVQRRLMFEDESVSLSFISQLIIYLFTHSFHCMYLFDFTCVFVFSFLLVILSMYDFASFLVLFVESLGGKYRGTP